jgi:hypothetical protein
MTNKYTEMMAQHRANGSLCSYCKRTMDIRNWRLMPTRDHIHPKSKGGRQLVWACWQCNHVKADMDLQAWQDFMAKYPRWWEKMPNVLALRSGVIPIAETRMILRHGKTYWRKWKREGRPVCECCAGYPLANQPEPGL